MPCLTRVCLAGLCGLSTFLVFVAPRAAHADPILVNGSFELGPNIPTNDIDVPGGFTGIFGWTVFGPSIDYMGPPWDVSDGSRAVDLDGRNSAFAGIAQTFETIAGDTYRLTFDLSGNPGGGPLVKQMRVAVAGSVQDYSFDSSGQTIEALIWDTVTFSFVATSSTSTLSFMSLSSTPNSYGALVDNVSVQAIPEPSAAMLLLLGAAVLGRVKRRRAVAPSPIDMSE